MTRVLDSRSPDPEKLVAHLRLAYWYFLAGRNRAAQPHYDTAMRLAGTPQGDGTGAFIHHFSRFADQSVAALEPSTLRYETKNGTIWLPLTINGVATAGLLDTGAGLSAVNESTALRFGLPIFDIPPTEATDFGNKRAAIAKIAFAHQLDLGKIRLTNVPFLVLSDKTWPIGPVLGLQILLACRRITWNADGGLRLAHPSPARPADCGPNLVLDDTGLLAAASFAGRPLDFELDTASPLSHLYQHFADAFPALVKERGTSKRPRRPQRRTAGHPRLRGHAAHRRINRPNPPQRRRKTQRGSFP